MKKFLPVVFCGIAAISYSQLTLAGDDYKSKDNSGAGASSDTRSSETRTPSGAGPTDNPNVTRDAQGREHVNQGKHTGQYKNKKDKDDSYSSGSGSTSERKKDDSYGRSDSSLPSASGSASGSATGSAQTQVK